MTSVNYQWLSLEYGNRKYDGLLHVEDRDAPTIMHLHGTGGNFYGNAMIKALGELYVTLGLNYLTVNLPGFESSAREEFFEDSRGAIDAWLETAALGQVILQGHSLGALKAIDYMRHGKRAASVKSVILLSPFDIVAFYGRSQMQDLDGLRGRLTDLATKSGGAASVPSDIFSYWDISIATILRFLTDGGVADLFPSRDETRQRAAPWMPSVPTLAVIGGEDFACYPSPSEVYNGIQPRPNLQTALIAGAPHNFDGRIGELRTVISEWLKGRS